MKDEFTYLSPVEILLDEKNRAIVELLPAGEWLHPQAPSGKLVVKEELLDEFIANFKKKISGPELPVDFRHEGETGTGVPFVGAWIVDMVKKVNNLGHQAIYAVLSVTDPETRKRIKEKSLKYISPEIRLKYRNPVDSKFYNIIRAASLTNWPYIKNMCPITPINFEEIRQREEVSNMTRFEELQKKEKLTFAELEEYRELLNDDPELDAEEISFKMAEAYQKTVFKDKEGKVIKARDPAAKKEKKDDKEKDAAIKEAEKAIELKEAELKEAKDALAVKGGNDKVNEELKVQVETLTKQVKTLEGKTESSTAQTFSLQEKMRQDTIDNELDVFVAKGKITPAMRPIAEKIMLAGESVKARVTIELSDGKVEKKDTNLKALFEEFINAMPDEWKVDMTQVAQKGVTVKEKEITAEGVVQMTDKEFEEKQPELEKTMKKEYDKQAGK